MSDSTTPAGSSTYDSSTMYVGDGTWISSENTFLLPNLQGLNFATMQYNGMANRFASLPQYHRLILGHGVLAALVFLLIVPSAIFIARFYYRNPRLALRLHIWLHILTVGLLTVVFMLGWFAVGPERSLTNPHHGIGLAIYVLVLVQALGGGLIHHVEKGKMRWRLPLKLMVHQWLGRAIALLGAIQIALGLTLYGSPKYLFILYALVCFAWLALYFILTYINRPVIGGDDGYGSESYVTGPTRSQLTDDRRTTRSDSHTARNVGLFGAGLAGLAALRRRSRSRRRDGVVDETVHDPSRSRLTSRHSTTYTHDGEKYPAREKTTEAHTWRDWMFGAAAGLGAYEGFKRLFGRGKKRDEESYIGTYHSGPSHSQFSHTDVRRVQEGQIPMSPGDSRISRPDGVNGPAGFATPTRQGLVSRRDGDGYESDSDESFDSDIEPLPATKGSHGLRDGIAALGVIGYLRERQHRKRDDKEQRRIDAMRREEEAFTDSMNRVDAPRHGSSRERRRQPSAADTLATSEFSAMGSNPELARNRRLPKHNRSFSTSAAANSATRTDLERPYTGRMGNASTSDASRLPGGPINPTSSSVGYPIVPGAVSMPSGPVDPDPTRLVDPYDNSSSRVPLGTTTAATAATSTSYSPSRSQLEKAYIQQGRRNSASHASPASVASPPVSVKVQMHKDGRHVTLRRLNEDEAAAGRDARKLDRRQRRRRAESLSSGVEDEGMRFRRGDAAKPASDVPIGSVARPPSELNLPPPPGPPPVPAHSLSPQPVGPHVPSNLASGVGSPGTYDTGTGTDISAFDTNRRRRRAERAAARERAAQQGARVEFT
ncbi:hypothetical protein AAFC00_001363 [Neodothiora populina]|uniref:Cytochrome b561 domain-containing protein n=1 Tax=Neodothiora populina TaxID=2781224 RepID=A0ABR3PNP7_9PEZI